MKAMYIHKVESINAAARFFALGGYHVTTAFSSNYDGMEVTVFFYRIEDKKIIKNFILRYKEDIDKLEFDEYGKEDGSKFYTYTLTKFSL